MSEQARALEEHGEQHEEDGKNDAHHVAVMFLFAGVGHVVEAFIVYGVGMAHVGLLRRAGG